MMSIWQHVSLPQHDGMSTRQHVNLPDHVSLPEDVAMSTQQHVNQHVPQHDGMSTQQHVSSPKHATQLAKTTVPVVGTVSRRIDPEQTELEEDSIPRPATIMILLNSLFALSKVSAATGYRYEVGKSNFPA